MKKTIVSSLMLLSCSVFAVESRIEIRHREAGGVGYNTGYSSLDYFLMTDGNIEFLLDLRGHVFNNGKGAGNFGFGARKPIKDEKYLIGVNGFYDIRQSKDQHSKDLFCHQVGVGLEWLGQNVDFRVNGYLPVGKTKVYETKTFDSFAGRNGYIQRKLKAALPSIDAEIGTPHPKPFYFAVGAYYLFKQSASSVQVGGALGGRVRAEVDIGRYFTLGFAFTYDRIFKARPQGYASINIPFDSKKCKKPKKEDYCHIHSDRNLRRFPIMRNEIIPVEHKKRTKTILTGTHNNPVGFLFVNNLAAFPGDGSFENPFAALKDAEIHSKKGDIIYVFSGDGTARNYDQGITLKDKQVLASSGANLTINDVIIPALTPGSKPHITNVNKANLSELTVDDIIANKGTTRVDDFFWVPPWEYLFGTTLNSDPYADAKDEGFVVVEPEAAPAVNPGGVAIIDNYIQ